MSFNNLFSIAESVSSISSRKEFPPFCRLLTSVGFLKRSSPFSITANREPKIVEYWCKERLMNIRYQNGHVRCRKRKDGSSCWVFMWREQDSSGKRLRRTIMIGSTEKYPTKELA